MVNLRIFLGVFWSDEGGMSKKRIHEKRSRNSRVTAVDFFNLETKRSFLTSLCQVLVNAKWENQVSSGFSFRLSGENYQCRYSRAPCAVKSRKSIKILKKKQLTLLSFDHFWTDFGYVSQIPVIQF